MKLRIDRVIGGPEERPIERWELLDGGLLILTLEAEDLHALAAEAMRADGQRQGLVRRVEAQPQDDIADNATPADATVDAFLQEIDQLWCDTSQRKLRGGG